MQRTGNSQQLQLPFREPSRRGGSRPNAGRPRTSTRRCVPHRARPLHKERFPVLVTLRAARGLPNFRTQTILKLVKLLLTAQQKRVEGSFRVPHFSIQGDHLHLIVEAEDGRLDHGIRGFIISFARRLNRLVGRQGRVWGDRYHREDLTSPRHTRNALAYVLNNHLKHDALAAHENPVTRGVSIDLFSSAPLFDAWSTKTTRVTYRVPWPDMKPRTWLLARGWKLHGATLDPRGVPGRAN